MGKVNCFLLFIKPTIFDLTWWSKSRWVSPMHVILELFWSSVLGVVLVGLCCCKSTTWQHEMIRKNSRSFQFDTNITSAYQRTSRTIYKVFQLIWFCLMSSHHWVSVTFKKNKLKQSSIFYFISHSLGLRDLDIKQIFWCWCCCKQNQMIWPQSIPLGFFQDPGNLMSTIWQENCPHSVSLWHLRTIKDLSLLPFCIFLLLLLLKMLYYYKEKNAVDRK